MGEPDNWEDNVDESLAKKMPSMSLNASAPSFVPNANAPAFVPSFAAKPAAPAPQAAPVPAPAAPAPAPKAQPAPVPEAAPSPPVAKAEKKEQATKQRLAPEDSREHVNIIFIGHVDAGKSTIGGHIMYLTGQVDQRTLEKNMREAKEKNRETWYLSWALDTNQEERDKGKTVECGLSHFDTKKKRFTILDAPGHKSFVPNMISGAAQADIAVLVISARKGEYETGFERGGQTREHAMLAKTAGVKLLIVVINKMDDPTVQWSKARYQECVAGLTPYLKKCGYNPKKEVYFMPISGQAGTNLKERVDPKVCDFYKGPSLLEYLDELPRLERMGADSPLRLPIMDKYKDMGTVVLGKIETGSLQVGDKCCVMPNGRTVEVVSIFQDEDEVKCALAGDSIKVKLKGIEDEDIMAGFVLCDLADKCSYTKVFDAKVVILDHKSIIAPGFTAVMHIHTCTEEVVLNKVICLIDKKTGEKKKGKNFVKQDDYCILRFEMPDIVCMEKFNDFQQLGRFTLRDEGKTIAIGKVVKLLDSA